MRIIFIALCCVLVVGHNVMAESNNEIKRGQYPFTALVYYSDESIKDVSGDRFLRGAVLIKPNWLVSSAIDPLMINGVAVGFPQKTLLARVGATVIDSNFTVNEDEDEQEREVIQIIRPYNHSVTEWWYTGISVLKTLLPFNITSSVNISPHALDTKQGHSTNCIILVYAKRYGNLTEDKILMQLFVEMLPRSRDNCGSHYREHTAMSCAIDSDDNKNMEFDPYFCQGNSGGPLICDGNVMGLQMYINDNCKQPHLYQILRSWNTFLLCSIEEKLQNDVCNNTYKATDKDTPVEIIENNVSPIIEELVNSMPAAIPTMTYHEPITTKNIVSENNDTTTQTAAITSETEKSEVFSPKSETVEINVVKIDLEETKQKETTTIWPKEQRRKLDQTNEQSAVERQTNMEAQQKDDESLKLRSAAKQNTEENMCLMSSILLSVLVLACMD